jgi:hypothetical protein
LLSTDQDFLSSQVGLKGESLGVNTITGSSSVEWSSASGAQPLTWHKVSSDSQWH